MKTFIKNILNSKKNYANVLASQEARRVFANKAFEDKEFVNLLVKYLGEIDLSKEMTNNEK